MNIEKDFEELREMHRERREGRKEEIDREKKDGKEEKKRKGDNSKQYFQ